MKIGYLLVTVEGLKTLANAIDLLSKTKVARFEVHKDDDTHGIIRICATDGSGWIDLMKGFDKKL